MSRQNACEEYKRALHLGQKERRERLMSGKDPYPAVLDQMLSEGASSANVVQDMGLVEIPANLIVGTKSAGRITAFTASFLPLLDEDSEFAAKWVALCDAHMGDTGIRDPIVCFEYLGKFYVQEGNKRVSVLRYFGAPRIPGMVRRVVPAPSEEPAIQAYYEFMDFYKSAKVYEVQFRRPGDYARLLAALGKEPGEEWTEQERRTFTAYLHYFQEAFEALGGGRLEFRPEEAMLLWLEFHPFRDLGKLSAGELKKSLAALWENVVSLAQPEPVDLKTVPTDEDTWANLFTRMISLAPEHVNVAFVHQRNADASPWIKAHEDGREYLEQALWGKVTVRSYFNADTPELAEQILEQAVEDGAEVVFTTTPQLGKPTLKAAVQHPKVRFLNCSVDTPYSSIRTYYGRIYEGKFITGAIAGAMAKNDRIGYVGNYPIFGVPASINAFALGAQMTNPRATIELRWSCQPGDPIAAFVGEGIRVISNRDVPTPNRMYLEFGDYGTYLVEDNGQLVPLGSPCWVWGKFYENVIRSVLAGAWNSEKSGGRAVNYWWGMDSGVIDVKLSDELPDGVMYMAQILRKGLQQGSIDPFQRRIVAQNGEVKNTGAGSLSIDTLLRMNWLCENVHGVIPAYEDILPFARPMVRELGVYRDRIPAEKGEPL